MTAQAKRRVRVLQDGEERRPVFVVWEITTKCDQPCGHCGTRAGPADPRELSTDEALAVADSLARMRASEVTLIGGEAYLRADALRIVSHLADRGVRVSMQTGGRAFTLERARAFKNAGLSSLGVSIDGPARVHDRLRGNLGSHAAAIKALENAREVGLQISANTQVNRLTAPLLEETADVLERAGAETWQVQLTGPMGRAADRPEWIIEPWRIIEIIETLARIQTRALERRAAGLSRFHIAANNNIGYFGPHESLLRSVPGTTGGHYAGCSAGRYILGIESDGRVKGCPTLPTDAYVGASIRDQPLEDIWANDPIVGFTLDRTTEELWGFCGTCAYGEICRAGCSWTAHTTMGRRGNNPFCYHRATELRKQGVRERLVHRERAPDRPYDHGRYDIELEPWEEAPATTTRTLGS